MLRSWLWWSAVGITSLGLTLSSCGDSAEQLPCETGDERCDCYGNGTCNGDLVCLSDRCVKAPDDDSDDSNSEGDGDASTDEPDDSSNDDDSGSGDSDDDTSAGSDSDDGTSDDGSGDSSDTSEGSEDSSSSASGETPVDRYGQLSVSGTQLVGESGSAVQLKGVSSMWLNWDPVGYAESLDGLLWMRNSWGLQVFRAAMGVDADGAYLEDPSNAEQQVRTIIENAIEAGVYVIVDWHDHEAEAHQAEAEAFFDEISADYADSPNLLYEIYNEPLDVSWPGVVKPYHEAVISTIRANDPDNVIILGTPNWSQDVDIAAQDPVSGDNLMYTLHFYACTHGSSLRGRATDAYNAGLPLFVTEWGAADADGGVDGVVCEPEAQAWHDWMDARGIGWTAWKLDGCTDSTCLFTDQNVPAGGNWTNADLNGHAPFVIERLQADNELLETADDADDTSEPDDTSDGCAPTGMCADGDAMECSDGELVARDCSGCALLSCGESCCSYVSYFGAETYPDFLLRSDLVTGFSQSGSSAALTMSFDGPNQVGTIVFALDQAYAIDPSYMLLDLEAYGDGILAGEVTVSLEADGGEAGCQYPVYSAGDTTVYLDDLNPNCWGSFAPGDAASQINVRIDSLSAGSGELIVYSVGF